MYHPDKWMLMEVQFEADEHGEAETQMKVLGSWYGGYATGDSYRLNSGVVAVTQEEADGSIYWLMHGGSGSTYVVYPEMYGASVPAYMWATSIADQLFESGKGKARLLDETEALVWVRSRIANLSSV